MTPENKLKKLQDLLKILDESVTRDEFVKSFESVLNYVIEAEKKLLTRLDEKTTSTSDKLTSLFNELGSASSSQLSTAIAELKVSVNKAVTDQQNGMNFVRDSVRKISKMPGPKGDKGDKGDRGSDGRHGRDGVDGKDGKDGAPGRGGGAKGFTLYINGAKKLLTAQTINITGSGVSYNYANGRNDITITGGGGALSVLTATGTINDTNTAFTFASEPTLVVVNGAMYRNGAGVTISGTNITLDNPVGAGGDIYGLG